MSTRTEIDDRQYPCIIRCRGGWFAVQQKGDVGSGPWRTKEAAGAALREDYEAAHRLDRP